MPDPEDILSGGLVPRRNNYDDIINRHAQRAGLDPDLVRAVIGQESSGNRIARSPKGAQGLMQLMPATARRFGVRNVNDPEENIRGGTDYLKFLSERYKGDPDKILAGYNAGEGNVDKYGGIPPFRETQNYVPSVKARYTKLTGRGLGAQPMQEPAILSGGLTKPQTEVPDILSGGLVEAQPPVTVPPVAESKPGSWASNLYNQKPKRRTPYAGLRSGIQGEEPQSIVRIQPRPSRPLANNPLIPVDRSVLGKSNDADLMEQAVRNVSGLTFSPTANVKSLYRAVAKGSEGGFEADVQEEFQRLKEAQARSQTPEMITARKRIGAVPGSVSPSLPSPRGAASALQRFGGETLKAVGGAIDLDVSGIGNILKTVGVPVDKARDYLNARGNVLAESASMPMTAEGKEIERQLPEKATDAVTGLGLSLAQLILLKKATGLNLGPLMALETTLKNSDTKVADRAGAAAEAYAMGKILDQHLSRPMSAVAFGAPTAVQSGLNVSQGRQTLEDALLETGIQSLAGAALGGKPRGGIDATRTEVPGVAEKVSEAPETQTSKVGAVEPKIVRHSDPRIDGGEVIGKTSDGKLKVQNNEGGISIVKNPRVQGGNREAAIVKSQPAAEPPATEPPAPAENLPQATQPAPTETTAPIPERRSPDRLPDEEYRAAIADSLARKNARVAAEEGPPLVEPTGAKAEVRARIPIEQLTRAELKQRVRQGGSRKADYEAELLRRDESRPLSGFVRDSGGIVPTDIHRGELAMLGPKETGTTGLINRNAEAGGGKKMTAEYMMDAANAEGYRNLDGEPFENIGDFLSAVESDFKGRKAYTRLGKDNVVDFEKEYLDSFPEQQRQHDKDARISLLENEESGQIYDKIVEGKADESDIAKFRELAAREFLSPEATEDLIASARSGGLQEAPEVQTPTVRSQVGRGAEQLGFVQEGLTQQESRLPPKLPDQRARLVAEEEARQAAANPERTAALKTLADLKAKGMTVDDYERQGSLLGETPSPEKLKLLRELESGSKPVVAVTPELFEPSVSKARGEKGGIDVDLLTLGVRPFAKDVAARGREVAAGTKEIADGIKSLLAPPSRGEQAQQTSRIVRARASEMARAHDIAAKSLEGARKYFGSQRPQANYDFIDKMERGQKQSNPKTQQFADTFRKMLDERRDQIRALGTGKLENFITDYFPHIWTNPKKATNIFMEGMAKRPFEGAKTFLRHRVIPYTAEGLKLGLEPVSNNPVDLAVLKLREMDKYLMAHQVMNEMKDQGTLKFFKVSERLPDGWKQIDDRVATVFSRGEKGELILRGRYAAPEPAARIINNYLSPGLNATMFRVPFRAWRATSNLLNQFQLGFSAFHAGFTTMDVMVSRTAAGLEDIARGKPIRGLATIASTPVSPITNLMQGSKMFKEWYQPGTQGAEIGNLVKSMEEGGGRARMDQFYTNNAVQKFTDTLRQGNVIGAALRAPGASVELLSKPVLEWLVPRQKMGVFADLAKRELERLGPDATEAQRRHAMAKAWDSTDNRLGQLVYDDLFWNKTLKDLSMASVRSVGWNLGTLREVGGGLADYATFPVRAVQRARGVQGDPLFTHRMAYTAALPLVVGTVGAITQYLMTGKGPQELKDYFFPKTGALDENGNPERIAFPSYMKDVFHAKEEPGKVVTNKLHPLVGLISEMLRNEDYYGTKIRNEDDPVIQQLKDVAKHAGQSALPFSVRGYQKETERGGSLTKRALPFIGITPAPSYINKSPAEKLIAEKVEATLPRGARTKGQADRSRLRHQLQAKARNGQDITNEVQTNIQQGKLKPDDAHDILRDAKQTPLQLRYKRLPLKDALDVWDVMTPAERSDVKDILADKASSVDDLPENEQPEVKQKLAAIGLKEGLKPRKPREPMQPRKPRKPAGSGYVFQ